MQRELKRERGEPVDDDEEDAEEFYQDTQGGRPTCEFAGWSQRQGDGGQPGPWSSYGGCEGRGADDDEWSGPPPSRAG